MADSSLIPPPVFPPPRFPQQNFTAWIASIERFVDGYLDRAKWGAA